MRSRRLTGALACAVVALAGPPAHADDPSFLTLSGGVMDALDLDKDPAGWLSLEYRSDLRLLIVKPLVGIAATTDGAAYGYAGFNIDLYFGRRWVLSPGFAVGAFEEGDGKDLGNTVEFRSGAELAYRFANRARLGVSLHHISNASLGDRNPGTEVLLLNYSIPFGYAFSEP